MDLRGLICVVLLSTVAELKDKSNNACQENWALNAENAKCYHVSKAYASFDEASNICEIMGSILAPVSTDHVHTFLQKLLLKQSGPCGSFDNCMEYWIGVYDSNDNGTWKTVEKKKLQVENQFWARGYPKGKGRCVISSIKTDRLAYRGFWRNDNCEKPLRFICEKSAAKFRIINELMKWDAAYQGCKKLRSGAKLVILTSSKQNSAVVKYLKAELSKDKNLCTSSGPGEASFWLAAHRQNMTCDAPFVWKGIGEKTLPMNYAHWEVNPAAERCSYDEAMCSITSQSKGFKWIDVKCTEEHCPLCELF